MEITPPHLSILIVSFNTCEMTLACIQSIYNEAEHQNFEIIVVDNHSTDGSPLEIEKTFPKVRLIKSNENLGFARANNLAAMEAGGKFILLLNPDTVVLDHAIDHLANFAKKYPTAKIWGGRTVFADKSLNPTSCWRRMTIISLFFQAFGFSALFPNSNLLNREGYGGWPRDTVRHIDIVSGCFFLITRDLWRHLSGFDPNYFMYAEEADLCLRARNLGVRPLFTPKAVIIHFGGASESLYASKVVKLFAGKITLINNHWPPIKKFIAILLFQFFVIARVIGYGAFAFISRLMGKNEKQAGHQKLAKQWAEVWNRRREWINGYPNASK